MTMKNQSTKYPRNSYLKNIGIDIWCLKSPIEDAKTSAYIDSSTANIARKELCSNCNTEHMIEGAFESNDNLKLMVLSNNLAQDYEVGSKLFSDKEGILLNAILFALNLNQENIAIVKICCNTYWSKEIERNNPENLIIFGENSAQAILHTRKSYNELQGVTQKIKGIPTIVTFHPSELLAEPSLKAKLWEHLSLFEGIR